jgi:ATP-dependent helicase/nuclease subunit B
LFAASPSRRFTAGLLVESLEQLVDILVVWAKQYQFDPTVVETSFGLPEGQLPAWRIELDDAHALLLRGRIDRVDICRTSETGEALAVVIDYKSSARELDKTLLHHGLELQLLAYLGALAQIKNFDEKRNLLRLVPAGAFYVTLRSGGRSAKTRNDERSNGESSGRSAPQHRGRFDGGHLEKFDNRGEAKGDQFRYSRKQDGSFASRGNEALPPDEFQALIARVEDYLRQHGRDIYRGNVRVYPFRWKGETACDFCLYRPVCRFDPWTQPYRALRPPPDEGKIAISGRSAPRKAIA